jgi:phosphopantetheinyl transferase
MPPARAVHWLIQTIDDVRLDDTWLAPSEREKLASLASHKRRRDWRLGRWTTKQAVARLAAGTPCAVADPADLVVGSLTSGAACCSMAGHSLPWTISISHSHDRGLCAIAPGGTLVGCDLERVEQRVDEFPAEWFTYSEQDAIASARPTDRNLLVTLVWSAKESALKALGLGLTITTQALTVKMVETQPSGEWRPLHVHLVDTPEPLFGWWKTDGEDLLTVVTASALPPPVSLADRYQLS